MKLKLFLIALVLLLFVLASRAQLSSSIKFRSLNLAGVLQGGNGPEWQVQTINGISYKTVFAGIGAGIDNYYQQTIPLFLDLRKNILDKRRTPFLYLDLGVSLPADRKSTEQVWNGSITHQFTNGYYYDVGIGYSLPVEGKFSFLMSLGYSQKSMKEHRINNYDNIIGPFGSEGYHEDYDYTFRRFSIKLGLGF